MGIFTEGTPLRWSEIQPNLERIKECALDEFIALYNQLKSRDGSDQLKWGDEIEYTLVHFDEAKKKVRISLRAEELLEELSAWEAMNDVIGYENRTLWRPEFGSHMIEGTPGTPYGGLFESFRDVEKNMVLRRAELSRLLPPNVHVMSISFPALGTPDFTDPPLANTDDSSNGGSILFSDAIYNQSHPRFITLTQNIIERRGGQRVCTNVPIFRDSCTPFPFIEEFADARVHHDQALPDHIFLDHVGFGTGLCCLQVTMQGSCQEEARWLYDQLAPLTPLMVALSAATPIHRGILSDVDARWDVISKLADDRTPVECQHRTKGRFSTIDCYLHPSSAPFNDVPVECDRRTLQRLLEAGIDATMAQHIAHMFIWDPLLVHAESLAQIKKQQSSLSSSSDDDSDQSLAHNEEKEGQHPILLSTSTDSSDDFRHFESILSCAWDSFRFKPPPSAHARTLGWRVEFRPMEVQLTDFENAAMCCFLVLLTRVLLSDRLSLVMPMSLVDENMRRAQQRDAVRNGRFHFRTNLDGNRERWRRRRRHVSTTTTAKENGILLTNGDEAMTMNGDGKEMMEEHILAAVNGEENRNYYNEKEANDDGQQQQHLSSLAIQEMTLNEIINGTATGDFPGLVPLCLRWLDAAGDAPLDVETRALILEYLHFIQKRAAGECVTLARWMREFVDAHPDYRKDSICPDSTIHDMLKEMDRIASGEQQCCRLLGDFGTKRNWLAEAKAVGGSRWRSRQGSISRQTSVEMGKRAS